MIIKFLSNFKQPCSTHSYTVYIMGQISCFLHQKWPKIKSYTLFLYCYNFLSYVYCYAIFFTCFFIRQNMSSIKFIWGVHGNVYASIHLPFSAKSFIFWILFLVLLSNIMTFNSLLLPHLFKITQKFTQKQKDRLSFGVNSRNIYCYDII